MSRKRAVPSESKQTLAATPQNLTNNNAPPLRPTRQRLKRSVLKELWSIWRADPRVPSVRSRRSWAVSRNANSRLVDNWFLRRRTCAKKAGQPIPDESYDLPFDPPKPEQSATPIEPELEAVLDLSSDDTLVYLPDGDDLNDLEASSDTVFDEDTTIEFKRAKTPAYKEAPQRFLSEYHHFQPESSSADLYVKDRCDKDSPFENSFPVCNQGHGEQSNFTRILCPTKSAQDEVPSDSGVMPDHDPRENLTIPCLRLDFSPDTLWELSAIPFLFRTPPAVPPDNTVSHRALDDWTIIEDKLGRLANDGELDFSFLDVPHLASMELHD